MLFKLIGNVFPVLFLHAIIIFCKVFINMRRHIHYEKLNPETDFSVRLGNRAYRIESKFGAIGKEKEGVIYLTKNKLEENKIPLAVFLAFPEESLGLAGKRH